MRRRASYVSSRSRRTVAAALFGARVPAASSSSATVASAAARENRVGGRNSRTSSQLRAASTSPDEADDVASRSEARRIVVHTSARAVANAAWSPAVTAVAASPSARSATRKACGRPASSARDGALGRRDVRARRGRVAEDQRRVGVGERELDVARHLPGRGVRRGSRRCEPEEAQQCGCRDGPNHHLLRDLDLESGGCLGHLARDRGRASLRRAAERVSLLRRESASGSLLRPQLARRRPTGCRARASSAPPARRPPWRSPAGSRHR